MPYLAFPNLTDSIHALVSVRLLYGCAVKTLTSSQYWLRFLTAHPVSPVTFEDLAL